MNNMKRGLLANTLVLHDFKKNSIDGKGWFYYVENLILKHGLTPSKMGGKGSKNITFARGKKQQEKEGFQDIQKGAWIAALPITVGTEMFDFLFAIGLDTSLRGICDVCWDDQITPFCRDDLEGLAKDLFAFLEPAYGYGYQREFRYGPSFYPFGVISGLEYGLPERKHITKWQHAYNYSDGRYRTGMLRDIYPINFLSPAHQDINIDGQKLFDWIAQSSDRGELKQLLPNFWSWWIPPEHIETVRQSLLPTNLLIAYG